MSPLRILQRAGSSIVVRIGLFLILGVLSTVPDAYAQREPGSLTVGLQVGWTSGLTAKLYRSNRTAYSALLTADGDDFARLSLFRLWERPLPDSPLHVYYGPGVALGGRNLNTRLLPEVSLSGKVGVNFYAERFEVFLHAAPTLRFGPPVRPRLWGGVGLRYDFHRP